MSLARILRLFWKRFLLTIAESMHDRVNFFIESASSLIIVGLNFTLFSVVYQHIPALGDYSYDQTLLVLGFYTLMDGISNFTLRNNVRHISRYVRLGEFDTMLVQPIDTQLNILRKFSLPDTGVIVVGLAIIGYSASELDLSFTNLFLTMAMTLPLGFLLHWAIFFGFCTIGFWLIKMEHLAHLAMTLLDLGRFPIGAYGPKVGSFLTFVLPLAIVATIPADLLFGRDVWQLVGIAAIVVVALFALSRAFFFWALRSYSSVSG